MLDFRTSELRQNDSLRSLTNTNFLRRGRQGSEIAIVQKALGLLGYEMTHSERTPGAFDGIYGGSTESTVKRFQTHQNIKDDGLIGPTTIQRVDADLVDLPKPSESEVRSRFDIRGDRVPKNLHSGDVWRPSRYKAAVEHHLETLFARGQVPRLVLRELPAIGKPLRILPDADMKPPPPSENQDDRSGRSGHLNGKILFTPAKLVPGSGYYLGPDYAPEMTLLHEIFHGMRFLAGYKQQDKQTLAPFRHPEGSTNPHGLFIFHAVGELLAITVVNIHRSELNPRAIKAGKDCKFLRKDHGTAGYLGLIFPRPDTFHTHRLVKTHLLSLKSQYGFFSALAAVKAPYNPFRDILGAGI